jgi:hypothetical protein
MPGRPQNNDVNDDVTDDDVTDDTSGDDTTDDVTDNATDDSADNQDQQDDTQDDTQQDQGRKPRSRTQQGQNQNQSKQDPDDPMAGLRKALQAARQDARKATADLKALQRQHASAEERALLDAKEQGIEEGRTATREPLVRALVAAKLEAAGVQGTNTPRLVRLLDLDKIDLDAEGDIVGLDDQVDELKTEFPNLFAPAGSNGTRAPNVNGGAGNGRTKDKQDRQEPKGFAQQLADMVTGSAPVGQGLVGR